VSGGVVLPDCAPVNFWPGPGFAVCGVEREVWVSIFGGSVSGSRVAKQESHDNVSPQTIAGG
jgi:hypothetical protein